MARLAALAALAALASASPAISWLAEVAPATHELLGSVPPMAGRRRERRRLSGGADAAADEAPTPEHGYERLEIIEPFIPLAMAGCPGSECETSLGAALSGVRDSMRTVMAVASTRVHLAGVAGSAHGTYVYFTVEPEADGGHAERTPLEAKMALAAASTSAVPPQLFRLFGFEMSKYSPSGDSLPCLHCLQLSESCEATAATACATVAPDDSAATCTSAGACSHTPAVPGSAAAACAATDFAACAAAALNGAAATCTTAGACAYASSIHNVTVTHLATPEHNESHAPLGIPFTFFMISLVLGTFGE